MAVLHHIFNLKAFALKSAFICHGPHVVNSLCTHTFGLNVMNASFSSSPSLDKHCKAFGSTSPVARRNTDLAEIQRRLLLHSYSLVTTMGHSMLLVQATPTSCRGKHIKLPSDCSSYFTFMGFLEKNTHREISGE